ncbi:TBC1 domain family member 19 [Echinococcus granulosus]|nr:TBC1 domain family member 19 [Echinococcus granulosus]
MLDSSASIRDEIHNTISEINESECTNIPSAGNETNNYNNDSAAVYDESKLKRSSTSPPRSKLQPLLFEANKLLLKRFTKCFQLIYQDLKSQCDVNTNKTCELILENWDELSSFFKHHLLLCQCLQNLSTSCKPNILDCMYRFQQIGVDDVVSHGSLFMQECKKAASEVVNTSSPTEARKYLEKGCPFGFRSKIWLLCLNINVSDEDKMHYSKLKHSVSQNGLLVDHLIHKEMKLIVSNDDAYFVFVDYIYKFRLYAISTTTLLSCILSFVSSILDTSTNFTPSPTTKRILLEKEPRLVLHLMSIGSPPLQIAFRWLLRGFSGYLAVEQVLLLWDRVLAWDSIEILAILAAAIFAYRSRNLMEAKKLGTVEAILADTSALNVTALTQSFLFTTSKS